jgi:hypothetical protein
MRDTAAWIERALRDPVWRSMYSDVPSLQSLFPYETTEVLQEATRQARSLLGSGYSAAERGVLRFFASRIRALPKLPIRWCTRMDFGRLDKSNLILNTVAYAHRLTWR